MTLDEFLMARYAEEEAEAPEVRRTVSFIAEDGYRSLGFESLEDRVDLDLRAKRVIVRECAFEMDKIGTARSTRAARLAGYILKTMAVPYANHEDFQAEWAP